MRKIVVRVLVAMMILCMIVPTMGKSAEIKVTVNGNAIAFPDAKPFIDANSRTMVPVRFVSEALGAEVDYATKGDQKQVIIELNNKSILLVINSEKIYVLDKSEDNDGLYTSVAMDTCPVIKDNRTFVPLRFISEGLGAEVKWEANTRTVVITTDFEIVLPEPKKEETLSMKNNAKPVSTYGGSFQGALNTRYDNVIMLKASSFPINTGYDEIYSVKFSKDKKSVQVIVKPIIGGLGDICFSDKDGLNRGRNSLEYTEDRDGIFTANYDIVALSDYGKYGEAYDEFSINDIEYIVFEGTEDLYAIPKSEVLK